MTNRQLCASLCICMCVSTCAKSGKIISIWINSGWIRSKEDEEEEVKGEEEVLKNQACLSLGTQTEIRMNEQGLPITLIIDWGGHRRRTDLSLLEPSAAAAAAAGPGVDLRLRGRPGPRRAGLRDVSSFLQRRRKTEEEEEEEGDQRCSEETGVGCRSNCIKYEQTESPAESEPCSLTEGCWL